MASAALPQLDRFLQLWTPLGGDWLVLRSARGREAISECFWFDLEIVSERFDLKPADLIAKPVTVGVAFFDEFRYIQGVVSEFTIESLSDRTARYKARVVPWLWFLTRTTDCAIFQNKDVPEIIEDIFRKYDLRDYKNQLQGSYPKREYCVQYRETAFDFIMRLMQEEGICFYFEHEDKKHTLVLVDAAAAHMPCPLLEEIRWEPSGGEGFVRDQPYVYDWLRRVEVKPKQWRQADYDFEKPRFNLNSTVPTHSRLQVPSFEKYDYPGRFLTANEAETYTTIRMEEEEAAQDVISGRSYCQSFTPGYRFKLTDHFRRDQNADYLLTSVEHDIYQADVFSEEDKGSDRYSNFFTSIPRGVPFRPPRTTPRPVIAGPQTAFVTGPPGEEIYTDKHGRVKVQFHWDRVGQYDEKSSCWLRVSQSIAGKAWGGVALPRVGQEVIVEFLEGDPDRPLITGSVYNSDHTPPYKLPDERSKSTFKSYSYKGGGGFNEFRMEDSKGKEQLFIHAERNMDLRVKNDQFTTILNEGHLTIGKDQLMSVKGDQHLTVTGDQNQKVNGTISTQSGMDWQQKVGMKYALDAGTEVHVKSGMNLVVESGTTLTLKVGGNFININSAGIFIKGNFVMINSGGAAGSGAGASPESPKPPTDADVAEPGQATTPPPSKAPGAPVTWSPQAIVMKQANADGTPFCEICEQMRREAEASQ